MVTKFSNAKFRPVVHGAMGCGQINFVSVAVPAAPVRVPSQRPLAPSVASVTSVANDKGDNEMTLRAVLRSSGICLTAEENKPNFEDLYGVSLERNADVLLNACKDIGLAVNIGKPKYMKIGHHRCMMATNISW